MFRPRRFGDPTLRSGARKDGVNVNRKVRSHLLHVEYAERGHEYGILFIFSLLCEYIFTLNIYVSMPYTGAEYVIHVLVVGPPELFDT